MYNIHLWDSFKNPPFIVLIHLFLLLNVVILDCHWTPLCVQSFIQHYVSSNYIMCFLTALKCGLFIDGLINLLVKSFIIPLFMSNYI